ncbi:MAG: hypothetical protein H6747_09735 [Deltaproteobacteria bacterium]|nr:hypothetical protein [Deltaproteobacteria bacterium]
MPNVRREDWKLVVVRPSEDRAAAEAAFDATTPMDAAERLALAWQLSVEAGRLAGWGDGEQGLRRSDPLSPRR